MWDGSAKAMLYLSLYELGINSEIPVSVSEDCENSFSEGRDTLIIDMREYQKKSYVELKIPLSVKPFF